MADIWITSDTHFGHAGMLKFLVRDRRTCSAGEQQCDAACKSEHPEHPMRPFKTIEEMDETLIERWNTLVKPADKVYHLGDVTMNKKLLDKYMSRLNGKKRLVRGNHDDAKTSDYLRHFDEVYATRILDRMLLSHIPVHPESIGKSVANVHGHIHNNGDYPVPYLNVCVEVTDYRPLSLDEVRKRAGY